MLDHARSRACAGAERALNRALHGSCHVPVAAYASLQGNALELQALVGSAADGRSVRAGATGPASDPEGLGREVAGSLLAAGAGEFLPAPGTGA